MSRSLGDHDFKDTEGLPLVAQAVSPEPDVYLVERTGREDYLVLGCDGLLDVLTNDDVANFLYSKQTDGVSDPQVLAQGRAAHASIAMMPCADFDDGCARCRFGGSGLQCWIH